MNWKNILKTALAALVVSACGQKEFDEVTELKLSRCLEPQNLQAKIDPATGEDVTFSWDVNKDADGYNLVIYTDEEMTIEILNIEVAPEEVPYRLHLEASQEHDYYFKVQALSSSIQNSTWAVYEGNIAPYAVKDNLYLEVTGRTATSVSLAWSNQADDYKSVSTIVARPVAGGSKVTLELTEAMATAAAATVQGLAPSKEYQVTLYYVTASRGTVDVWTQADPGEATVIATSDALKAALAAGGNYYLSYSSEPYSMGTSKPAASLSLVGELGPKGEKPVVVGKLLTDDMPAGSSLYLEGICFDGDNANSRIVEHTGGSPDLESITFVNCDITKYLSGLYYDNNDNVGKVGTLTFDSCDIYANPGSGGDAVDLRKTAEIGSIVFRNNTIWDGIRTMFRIDGVETITIGSVVFENNTVKNVSTMDDGNNRGFFAIRVAHALTLKNNLFLYEDGGKSGADVTDRAQLFQINAATVSDNITAANNYSFAAGQDFFTQVSAATCGFKILPADPCFNSKGNFFQLANQDLIDGKVGASKWWIPYVVKPEDLTQNVITEAHTWNLQDASLFAGDVKNSRVRDELLLVGTEATPLNADEAINFLSASVLNRKGNPTEGYIAFKVDKAGSVDLLVADPKATGASVVVALFDDEGLAIQGGAVASAANPGVQKIVVPEVKGEGIIYLYSTGAVSLTKLAWSEDVLSGNKVLATPKPVVDPVTLTEGDETPVTITWDAISNAATYQVIFNKRSGDPQTELSFTVPAEDIAALKAGLYSFTVQAFPADGDIYYTKSEQGSVSFAIQPKASEGGETVEVDQVWDFSAADWQEAFAAKGAAGADITDWDITLDGLQLVSKSKSKYATTYFQFGGKSGDMDRYFQFTAPEQGTLKITVSNTGSSEAADRTVEVKVGADVQSQVGGAPSTAPVTLEYSVAAGDVLITAPVNGLRFYKIEYIYSYTTGGGSEPIEYDWDFSTSDWQAALGTLGAVNTDITNIDITVEGLLFHSGSKSKYNTTYIQFGGKSGDMDRYFKFTAPEQGTLKVKVSNTGSAEAMDRTVAVTVGSDTQSQPGGFGKSTPGILEYSVMAGEVVITAPENGLCFYEISYTNQ